MKIKLKGRWVSLTTRLLSYDAFRTCLGKKERKKEGWERRKGEGAKMPQERRDKELTLSVS